MTRNIPLILLLTILMVQLAPAQNYQEQMKLIRPRPENVLVYGAINMPDQSPVTNASVSLIDPFSHVVVENIPSDQQGWYLFSVKKGRSHGILIEVPGLFPYYSEFTVPLDHEAPLLERPILMPATLGKNFILVFNPGETQPETKSRTMLEELGTFLASDPQLLIRIVPEDVDPDPRRTQYVEEKLVSMGIPGSRISTGPSGGQSETTVEFRISTNPADIARVSPGASAVPADESWTIQFTASRNRIPMERFKDLDPVFELVGKDGYYRYTHGNFPTQEAAQSKLQTVKRRGYNQAFIKTFGSIKKL